MQSFLQDIRFGTRMIRKRPGLMLVAVFTLALGISINSMIFSVVNAVLLRSLSYENSEQLAILWQQNAKRGLSDFPASYPDFVDFKEQNQSFQSLAAFKSEDYNVPVAGEVVRVTGAAVSSEFFALLDVPAAVGHTFSPGEHQAGTSVVLSHAFWQRYFGGNSDTIGKPVTLNEKSYEIIGVMPETFRFPGEIFGKADLWVPLTPTAAEANSRAVHTTFMVARLKPGVGIDQAQAEVGTIAGRLAQQYQDTNTDWGVTLKPLREQLIGNIKSSLLILLGAVGFVLLIACVNVGNLLLANASTRQREIATRMAIGAGRFRIVRQLLTENLLLAFLSGAVGLLLAVLGVSLIRDFIPPAYLKVRDIAVDWNVLGFTLLICVVTALLFGTIPALQAIRTNPIDWIKEGSGKVSTGVRRRYLRNLLVVSEIALALVLFIGASLLIKSFIRLQQSDPGFSAANVLTAEVALPASKYPDGARQAALFQQLTEKLRNAPGVTSVGAVTTLPLSGTDRTRAFGIEGRQFASPSEYPTASYNVVVANYFKTLGIALASGRYFTEQDSANSPPVAIISSALARRQFPGVDAVGKRLIQRRAGQLTPIEIVGVVGDVKNRGLETEPNAALYIPYLQDPAPTMTLVISSQVRPETLVPVVRDAVRSLDPYQPIDKVRSMTEVVAQSVSSQRLNVLMLSAFAAIALLMAAVGIYSVVAHSVRQRTQEIGIRLALGAQRGTILRMILGQTMIFTAMGTIIGVVGALALTRLMAGMLYGVSRLDPLIFVGTPLLLAAIALLASYVPARKATKVDPLTALRFE